VYIERPSIYFHERTAIHVRVEIVREYVEDSSERIAFDENKKLKFDFRTFIATASRAPSVGCPRS